ncbi:hypothetical protein [Streptomyces sp. NPDC001843]|uniref:hypothetical protein n=1 Tax=Streptomyces sp. NPDC001843 TaxID=3364617 RepID=UPI003676CFE2
MADSEWFQIETKDGRVIASGMDTTFSNREQGMAAARQVAPGRPEDVLMLVKYTRKEIKTFTKRITVDEADVPAT